MSVVHCDLCGERLKSATIVDLIELEITGRFCSVKCAETWLGNIRGEVAEAEATLEEARKPRKQKAVDKTEPDVV